MYAYGNGVARDDARASAYHLRACERGNPNGCALWVVALLRDGGLTADNAPRAVELLTWACNEEAGFACYFLGVVTALGRGGAPDAARAAEHWRRAATLLERTCEVDHEDWACGWHAHLRRNGIGVPADVVGASDAYARLCERSPDFCVEAAELLRPAVGADPVPRRRVALLERACEGGNMRGCHQLADHLDRGDGVARDPSRARSLRASVAASLERDLPDDGNGVFHRALARLYRTGDGVARNPARAAALFESACSLGRSDACLDAATLRDGVEAGPRDPVRARALRDDACALGVRAVCRPGRPRAPAAPPRAPPTVGPPRREMVS
jgi:hypothetical protein